MKKGFGNNLSENYHNKKFLVKDIELSAQTKKAIILAKEGIINWFFTKQILQAYTLRENTSILRIRKLLKKMCDSSKT